MLNPMDMTGKTVLVTGASSGIGRAVCVTLSQLGAKVVMVARREEQLLETCNMLEGSHHVYYPYDLQQLDGIGALVKQIVQDNGKLDGLVYSAGIYEMVPLSTLKPEIIQRLMAVNVDAFIEIMRIFQKKSYSNESSSVVAVSSIASIVQGGGKAMVAYATSKAALEGAVRSMATELGMMKGVRVNAVCPAWTDTHMYQSTIQKQMDVNVENNGMERQFLGIIEPKEISMVVAFLLSPALSHITGQCIVVDGGYLLG